MRAGSYIGNGLVARSSMAHVQEPSAAMTVDVRPFEPKDYPAVVRIRNAVDSEHPTTVEERRHADEEYRGTRYVRRRYIAIDPSTDEVVGESEYYHLAWAFAPDRYGVWGAVHPDAQGRGLGAFLYDRLERELLDRGARQLRSSVQDSWPTSVAFLRRRGFQERARGWESRLDLRTFDMARFAHRRDPPPGIVVTTLADEMREDPGAVEKLYDLDCLASLDEPHVDAFTPGSLEMYRHHLLDRPGALPGAIFLAKDGDAYVGVSGLGGAEALPDVLYTGFTGVHAEYRQRGIAYALKLRAVEYGIRHGYREIRTWNSSLNAPMLGINVGLGFVKQPAWIIFGKDSFEGSR